jgi:hypothetical protein
MVIYHLGFPAHSYLAAKVFSDARIVPCDPLEEDWKAIIERRGGLTAWLFHIDLSVQDRIPACRPDLVKDLNKVGIRVLNANHIDQRKRTLQLKTHELGYMSLTAEENGDPEERLLIKADLNVAGGPERRTLQRFPKMPVPHLPNRICSPSEYYATERQQIPPEVWNDPTLQVERLITNHRGIFLRTFYNQGRGVVSVIENPHEIVKKSNAACKRWNYTQPADELTQNAFAMMAKYAKAFDVSFFAADWVVDDASRCYLVDLNLTPQWVVNRVTQTGNMTPELHMADIPDALKEK